MYYKFRKTFKAGIYATLALSLMLIISKLLGFIKRTTPEILADYMQVPIGVAWLVHFMIGIFFAYIYTFWYINKWEIENKTVKMLIYGLIVFVIGQFFWEIILSYFDIKPFQNDALQATVSFVASIVYAFILAKTMEVREN